MGSKRRFRRFEGWGLKIEPGDMYVSRENIPELYKFIKVKRVTGLRVFFEDRTHVENRNNSSMSRRVFRKFFIKHKN